MIKGYSIGMDMYAVVDGVVLHQQNARGLDARGKRLGRGAVQLRRGHRQLCRKMDQHDDAWNWHVV